MTLCHEGGTLTADVVVAATGGRPCAAGARRRDVELPLAVDARCACRASTRVTRSATSCSCRTRGSGRSCSRTGTWRSAGRARRRRDRRYRRRDSSGCRTGGRDIGELRLAEVGWAGAAVEVGRRGGLHVGPRRGGDVCLALVVDEPRRLREARRLVGDSGWLIGLGAPADEPASCRLTSAAECPSASTRRARRRSSAPRRSSRTRGGASTGLARASPDRRAARASCSAAAASREAGSSVLEALDDAARVLDTSIAQPRPRFFAFVGSSGLEIGVLGDLLASCFDVNLAVWAGAASEVEDQAVRWVSEFIGYPRRGRARSRAAARSRTSRRSPPRGSGRCPARGATGMGGRHAARCTARARRTTRSIRAAELLGLGADWVRALPHGRAIGGLVPEAVAEAIDADRAAGVAPVAVVATAGTTLTGAVDPIDALADVCEARGVWLHVDGAYGVAAASTPSAGAPVRRARARRLRHARRAQVALPAEGVRRRARPTSRGPRTARSRTRRTTSRTSGPTTTWSTSRSSTRGRSAR